MGIQSKLASIGGDLWCTRKILALWPWPAVMIGQYDEMCDEDDYRCFTNHLLPGDMLMTTCYPFPLSNYFIGPTVFKHAVIYTGAVTGIKNREHGFIDRPKTLGVSHVHTGHAGKDEYERTITHAISEGVVCQDVLRLLKHVDFAIAVRPWKTQEEQVAIVGFALKQVGLGYNFDFTPSGPKEFYCTELCVEALKQTDIQVPETRKRSVSLLGKKAYVTLADAFVAMYDSVCCSVSCLDPKFYRKSSFGDIVREKIMAAQNADAH